MPNFQNDQTKMEKLYSQDKTGNSKISSNDSNVKHDVEENISL